MRAAPALAALAVLALGGAGAEEFRASARLGAVVPFPGNVRPNPSLTVEAGGLGGTGFAVRLLAGLDPYVAVDALYRFTGNTGPLYLGLGLGFSGVLEGRLVVGYAWPLSDFLEAYLEGVPRLPLAGGAPSLELAAGFGLRF